MKKRILTLLLIMAMAVAMITTTASAVITESVYVAGIGMSNGDYLEAGATATTTTAPDDNYAYYADGVLTLHNYSYEGEKTYSGALIYSADDLLILLEGDNTLSYNGIYSGYGISVNASLTLAEGVDGGSLTVDTIDGIYSADDLTIDGGEYTITAEYDGIDAKAAAVIMNSDVTIDAYHAISSDGNIVISNSMLDITAEYDSINSGAGLTIANSTATIVAQDGLVSDSQIVISNSTLDITSDSDGIHSEAGISIADSNVTINVVNFYGIQAMGGKIVISNSKLDISAPYGIHDDNADIIVASSDVSINATQYGILTYGGDVRISDNSTLDIIAEGNGIQAEGDITIANSDVTIDANYGIQACGGHVVINNSTLNITGYNNSAIYTYAGLSIESSDVIINADSGIYSYGGLSISNSTLEALTEYDGICASNSISIDSSTITIDAYNGIYSGDSIVISNSKLDITADDDGICSYSSYIDIINTYADITADDDGIDTGDGNIDISGGIITIAAKEYAIVAASDDIIIRDNADVTARSTGTTHEEYHALYFGGELIIEDLLIYASEDAYGKLGTYIPAKNKAYDLVVIDNDIRFATIIGFKAPEVGRDIASNLAAITVPEGAPYTISSLEWYSYFGAESGAFKDHITYYLVIELTPVDGYEFAEDAALYINHGSVDVLDEWTRISPDKAHYETIDYALCAEHVASTPATCKNKAICKYCYEKFGELDPNNHEGSLELRGDFEEICDVDGYTGDFCCTACDSIIIKGEAIPAPGHDWTAWFTTAEPTCDTEGTKTRTCSCGAYEDKSIDALGHVAATEADCVSPATCAVCGESFGEINAEKHTGNTEMRGAIEAAVGVDGYTGDLHCADCGALLASGEVIPALPAPETTAPETTAPETTVPETAAPETTAPETDAPETDAPETTAPETTVPETSAPETSAPETSAPETTVPETTVPETTVPEITVPETTAPTEPETGDNSLAILLAVVAVAAIGCAVINLRKREEN